MLNLFHGWMQEIGVPAAAGPVHPRGGAAASRGLSVGPRPPPPLPPSLVEVCYGQLVEILVSRYINTVCTCEGILKKEDNVTSTPILERRALVG